MAARLRKGVRINSTPVKRLVLILVLASAIHAQDAVTIPASALRAHMRFLADDALEGRESGTRGFDVAAQYVAAQFEAAGLQRIGASWMQPIAFRTARVAEQSLTLGGTPLTVRTDFLLSPNFHEPLMEISAPVAVAGYGITSPELYHDDYKMVDVRGRIVVVISGAPASFPTDQRAYYSSAAVKAQNAVAHGAIGLLTVNSLTDERRVPYARRVQQEARASMRALVNGELIDPLPALKVSGRISQETLNRILDTAPVSGSTLLREADNPTSTTFGLQIKTQLTAKIVTTIGQAASANVIGVVRGTDPQLRDEYLLVSAHLDHLGISTRPGTTDTINNGAQDNASGIAVLIEMARALAQTPPKRSVAFIALTGEEKGLQGSRYFAANPAVPAKSIIADVNMDMFFMRFATRDLVALGGEHSTLGESARIAASEEGFELSPDPMPAEVRFIRSDQFSFIEKGIPAIHVKGGTKAIDPKIDGLAVEAEWLQKTYHTPADDMSQPLDFDFAARYAQTNLRLVRAIANAAERPAWHPNDFFGSLPRR